jgi:uncharacterized membrane protein
VETMVDESSGKRAARWILALFMIGIGITHFVATSAFVAIVPAWLPAPRLLVLVSGVCEIAGGVGLVVPGVQRAAAIGLVLLYVAVFPANVNMAVHHIDQLGVRLPAAALWARLPFQLVFIAWAWWLARAPRPRPASLSATPSSPR